MGRVADKVAFITGAARGQGRSHAVRLAEEGADIIAIDIAEQIPCVSMSLATEADLAETVRQVEALGRRIVGTKADVRDYDAVKRAVDDGVAQLGRLDIVSANAATATMAPAVEFSLEEWKTVIDVDLNGVWHTVKAAVPHIRAGGKGGSIVITSSVAGLSGAPNVASYSTAKHGLVGLMRCLALELAPDLIRVNTVHPGNTNTELFHNESMYRLFLPDQENPSPEDFAAVSQSMSALPVPWVEPIDISNALLWLASDEARYVTGVALPIDAGTLLK